MGGLTNLSLAREPISACRLVGYPEAARFLAVKVGTLRAWVCNGVVPFYRVSPRLIRFDLAELELWLSARKAGAR
jgi:excisionase family DNA binding protein